MEKGNCNTSGCKQIRDNKSIYHPSWKSGAGKGDQPRKVTKKYEENYTEIFPNSFKPKWQIELDEQSSKESSKN